MKKLLFVAGATVLAITFLLPGCSWFKKQPVASKQVKKTVKVAVVCPLCGREVADRSAIDRRPVAVKVENDPAARPQSGLDKACIVYEEITEGGITRFMPIYLCGDADPVGPVRSARPVDIDIVYPYSALFAHCGGGAPILRMIKESKIPDLDEFAWTGAYWRTAERRAPHNLYTSTERLRQAGDRVYPYQGTIDSPFDFFSVDEQKRMERDRRDEVKRTARANSLGDTGYKPDISVVNDINIPYTAACAVRYAYDPARKVFTRYVAGQPHTDLVTGRQLAADNVIIQYVTESSSGIKDVRGAESPELGVVGFGRAQVFTMGQLIDANWDKNSREEHTRYTDNSGRVIPLKPGQTWIQLVPSDRQVTTD